MKKMRGSITGREDGFTLIELMIVVLIIAILIAIAIPTFLGARERAQDRAAQSSLRNSLTAENVYYTDSQWFTDDQPTMSGIESSLTWQPAAGSTNQNEIVITVGGNANPAPPAGNEGTAVLLSVVSAHGDGFEANDVKVDSAGFTGNSYSVSAGVGVAGWGGSGAAADASLGNTDSSQGWRH